MAEPEKKKGGGKPFQSKLEPYFDLIRSARLARKTWAEIAEDIKRQGTDCTPQGVYSFFKAKRKRRYALGMEPDPHPTSVPNGPAQSVAIVSSSQRPDRPTARQLNKTVQTDIDPFEIKP